MHEVGRRANTPDHFLKLLCGKLNQLFALVRPAQSVCLCVDGPAAWAKVAEQRKRRRKAAAKRAKDSEGLTDDRSRGDRSHGGRGRGGRGGRGRRARGCGFSRNLLTPGVPFMDQLKMTLERWCRENLRPGRCLQQCSKAVVSGSSVVGEGEHKMLVQMLANGATAAKGSGVDPSSHVFISGDADLFLLSLVQGLCKRVSVISDVDHRNQLLTIWSTEALGEAVIREIEPAQGGARECAASKAASVAVAPLTEEARGLRRDFCLIALFSGDDYLPALGCAIPTKRIFEAYLEQRRLPQFQAQALVRSIPTELPDSFRPGGWAFTGGDGAFAAESAARFEFNLPLLVALLQSVQGKRQSKPDARVQLSESERRARAEQDADAVRGYLGGLLWVLELYHHGHCLDYQYIFKRSEWESGASAEKILEYAPALIGTSSTNGDGDANGVAGQSISPPDMLAQPQHLQSRQQEWHGHSATGLQAPRSDKPPLCPLACAVALLPADTAEELLVREHGMLPLTPLFTETHPVLGSVVKLERCADCERLKREYARLNKQLQEAKQQLQEQQQTTALSTSLSAPSSALAEQERALLMQIASLPKEVAATLPPAQRQQYDDALRRMAGEQEQTCRQGGCLNVTATDIERILSRVTDASNALSTHRATVHPNADMDCKDPTLLNEAVAGVWESVWGQRPHTLSFATPTVIENPGAMQRGQQHALRFHHRPPEAEAPTTKRRKL